MKSFVRYGVPFVVVGIGVGLFYLLLATKPQPTRSERRQEGWLVEVLRLSAGRQEVTVDARGQVVPAQRVELAPQVTGTVRWLSPRLIPGGRFHAGEPLLRLDARDYRLSVDAQEANRSSATLDLRLERERAAVAEREWELFGEGGESGAEALARRRPQVENAEALARAARSDLERARLDLSRTRLDAPFNAMVLEERVELSQLVGPTNAVVTLVGTDAYWVEVAVAVEHLGALRIPSGDGDDEDGDSEDGSHARVTQRVGTASVARGGRVLRLLPDLDPNGSMARLLVTIRDPLDLDDDAPSQRVPLLLGSYVEVAIEATPLEDVIEVPRAALRDGDRAYVMNDADELEIRDLSIVWRRPESVLVQGGLADGERLVLSRVPNPVPGLPLRTARLPSPRAMLDRSAAGGPG